MTLVRQPLSDRDTEMQKIKTPAQPEVEGGHLLELSLLHCTCNSIYTSNC